MYKVIFVGSTEKVLFESRDGYSALNISHREMQKTRNAIVVETPKGKRLTMAQQEKMRRRLKINQNTL